MNMLSWISLFASLSLSDCAHSWPKLYSVPIFTDGMEYRIPLEVGTPAKRYELMIDTGSTPTWLIHPEAICCPTGGNCSTCKCFGMRLFNCSASSDCADGYPPGLQTQGYGSGSTTMNMTRDILSLGGFDDMKLTFGEALQVINARYLFSSNYDGFLGLGWPGGVPFGNAQSRNQSTFITQLWQQNVVDEAVFALNLGSKECPGQMTVGGIDKSEFQGKITWAPLHNFNYPSKEAYWNVKIDGVRIRDGQLMGPSTTSIMDTGAFATLFREPSQIWTSLIADINQSTPVAFLFDPGLQLYLPLVNCTKVSLLPDLTIYLSGKQFVLSPQQYVYTDRETMDLITTFPGEVPQGHCIVGMVTANLPIGDPAASEAILWGNNFLKAFYSAWDIEHKRFGLAQLPLTSCTSDAER